MSVLWLQMRHPIPYPGFPLIVTPRINTGLRGHPEATHPHMAHRESGWVAITSRTQAMPSSRADKELDEHSILQKLAIDHPQGISE